MEHEDCWSEVGWRSRTPRLASTTGLSVILTTENTEGDLQQAYEFLRDAVSRVRFGSCERFCSDLNWNCLIG